MKVAKNNNDDTNQALTLAELEAYQQFEQSHRKGQVLFRPVVAAGQVAPNCVAFLEEIGRFPMIILEGPHSVEGSNWWRHETSGVQTPVDNPLEAAWQSAKAVRAELKGALRFNPYAIAVVWLPDMEEDEDILDEASGRSVHLFFGKVDLVQRLASLPREDEVQAQLSRQYIEQEVAALSRPAAAVEPEPAEGPRPVNGRAGAMHIGRVETMNVYITMANGGGGDDAPPLITVQGQ